MSLSQGQYYGNPQNAFWWLMHHLLANVSSYTLGECSYQQRCEILVASKFAVWDVLADCERPGSLDSSIVRASEKANPLDGFLEKYSSIKLLAFNGAAAKTIFMRHCASTLSSHPSVSWVQLPSSSPAHARLSKLQKLELWREALTGNIE